MRGFIGLALDAVTATPGKPAYRVAFFLDEFGQLGRMDRLADSITLLRGYGVQLWLFVQDLSQLKAVYPRWQSFMANTGSSSAPPITTSPATFPTRSGGRPSASRPAPAPTRKGEGSSRVRTRRVWASICRAVRC